MNDPSMLAVALPAVLMVMVAGVELVQALIELRNAKDDRED